MAENEATGSGQAAPAAEDTNQSQAQSTEPETVGILPAAHWIQAAEETESTAISTIGDDKDSSTSSITSSILEYRTIQGRTYHSETGNAQYWATNDDKQNESMDINHHLLTLCLGGRLFLAPIKSDIKKAMDVGTGTGIWAIDFADEYPDIEVIGTDISPIQPSWVPPNLKFEIEDCTQDWTFPPNSFDYIHIRFLVGSIVDWTELFRQAYKCLKPGGYLESYEASSMLESDDGSVGPQSAMSQWGKFFIEGGRKLGRTFLVVNEDIQRKAMEEAGYVEIDEWNFKAPIGPWSSDPRLREIGQYARFTLDQDYEGYVLFMASVMEGWTTEEIQVYIATLRREVRSGKYHPYYRQKVVWGRKPQTE